MSVPMTTSEVARRFGVRTWQVRRLYERGLLPPADRVGLFRVIAECEIPAVERALLAAGYLKATASCGA